MQSVWLEQAPIQLEWSLSDHVGKKHLQTTSCCIVFLIDRSNRQTPTTLSQKGGRYVFRHVGVLGARPSIPMFQDFPKFGFVGMNSQEIYDDVSSRPDLLENTLPIFR